MLKTTAIAVSYAHHNTHLLTCLLVVFGFVVVVFGFVVVVLVVFGFAVVVLGVLDT